MSQVTERQCCGIGCIGGTGQLFESETDLNHTLHLRLVG
jgi:hypothetical protein